MHSKATVQLLLFLLSAVLLLDRIAISLVGHRIAQELAIPPDRWGWVLGSFALGYAAFDIPSGVLGDRIGPRRVLTRIVLWWSAFTALTGAAANFYALVIFRFLFGAGEAGAYPNGGIVISRWFSAGERGRAHGLMFLGVHAGGMLAPALIIPLQAWLGWRICFLFLGCLGTVWALAWWTIFRDHPPNVTPSSRESRPSLDWGNALRNPGTWCLAAMYFFYCYAGFFYMSWFPTYLMRAKGFDEKDLLLVVYPSIAGGIAYVVGGCLNDILSRTCGLRWGPRILGFTGFGVSALSILIMMNAQDRITTVVCFTVTAFGLSLVLPCAWAVCVGMAGPAAGSLTGFMNTAGQTGSFLSTVLFGLIASRSGSYEVPVITICAASALSGVLWLGIDGSCVLKTASHSRAQHGALGVRTGL